jgi:hypothetical protein
MAVLSKNFASGCPRNDDPRLGRLRDPCFFRPVGLARNAALRSPQGEALRAKCRATPTTGAAWQPAWRLASAPSDGALHATDGLPAASTSVSLPKSAHVGTPCGPVHREPAVVLARRFPASATHAPQTRCSSCRTAPRIPTLCSARARCARSAVPVGKSGCRTAPPNRH